MSGRNLRENHCIEDIIQKLRGDRDFMRDVVEWQRAPERAARTAPFPTALQRALIDALAKRGIDAPYTHQAHAIDAALRNEHVVVVASAAGGKSLCFHAPIVNALLSDKNARALCLFPTKSLAQDQLASMRALIDPVIAPDPSSVVQTYDGDTPQGKRAEIRKDGRVLVSNFDMLHLGILPHHARWAAFFRKLRYVVIDEMHTYRGIFGSHVANVIRRLHRICAFYNANPAFILASATIANPREHAERLLEKPVTLVDDDGSPHGEQHVVIINPPIVDPELGLRRSADFVVRDVASRLIDNGLQTICFARSRNTTEVLLTYLRERTGSRLSAKSGQPAIAGYRGGYLPDERRAIERGLRDGNVRGVVSTNALELGIDIGELDACVMHGYPGSIASFWQQAGRAGRRRQASLAIMVATADPLDQYLASHPQYLFEQSPEHARVAPDNLGVLAAHVACAAFELPFESGERLGAKDVTDVLDVLAEDGNLFASGGAPLPLFKNADGPRGDHAEPPTERQRYTWVGDTYPADRISLRGIGERVNIFDERGDLIGETDRGSAQGRVHVGAIYMHQAQTYLITELDWEAGRAIGRKLDSDHYTIASSVSEVAVLDEFGAVDATMRKPVAHGEIEVTTSVPRFRQVQFNTHQTLGWGEIALPEQTLLTTGYWFGIPAELADRLSREGILALPNDYGPNWAQQRDAARERDGHRCVVCGKPETPPKQHHVHHRKPFRTFNYRRGENEAYLLANSLDNLMTVCPTCHARVETAESVNQAMSGLCYLIGNLAPLYVMCDSGDLSASWDIASPHTRVPTVTIYEMAPGGTGIADELIEHHIELLQMASARVRDCACERGCPSCVGPVDEKGERNVKRDVAKILQALIGIA
jgi:DEAD/DEAH box helicase domain-containing protein